MAETADLRPFAVLPLLDGLSQMVDAGRVVRALRDVRRVLRQARGMRQDVPVLGDTKVRGVKLGTDTSTREKCRHCLRRLACRPCGMCSACFRDPDTRALYSGRGSGYRSEVGSAAPTLPASEPTDALPGTEGRVEAYMRRAEAGMSLYHPGDAGRDWRRDDAASEKAARAGRGCGEGD